jgi:hypothetical protein
MTNVNEIVEFMKERCVSISSQEEEIAVHCTPEWIQIRDLTESRPQLIKVSDDFLKGIVFAKYDFFLKEVREIWEELKERNEL